MLEKSLHWVNVCLLLQSTNLLLGERNFEMDNTTIKQINNRLFLLKYRYIGSYHSDFVPNPLKTRLQLSTHSLATRQESFG